MLTEVGFVAAGSGDVARAERIFGALRRLRPRRAFAAIGLALAYMNAGRPEEAAKLLEVAAEPLDSGERNELDAFRGLALHLAGRNSESVRALCAAGSVRLAQAMLGETAPTPVTPLSDESERWKSSAAHWR